MGWDPAFVDLLDTTLELEPRYVLESLNVPFGANPFGGDIALSSFRQTGFVETLGREGATVSGMSLTLRDWSVQTPTLTIPILGDLEDPRPYLHRGQALQLRIGFSNNPDEFESVFVGTAYNLQRRRDGVWMLQIRELSGALTSRFADTVGEAPLLHDMADTTTTDTPTAYTVGDPTLNVTSTTGFRTDGAGTGVIKVTDSASGNSFFLTYTGTTATSFTGLSSTGQFETTAINCQGTPPSTVDEVAYTEAHPITILQRILMSTGVATRNTAFDILPASWSYAIPHGHLGEDDMKDWETATSPSSGSSDVQWVQDGETENGLSMLNSFLNPGGWFMSPVQGQLSCRAILDPTNTQSPDHLVITPTDIASIDAYEAWAPTTPVEFSRIDVFDAGGGISTTNASVYKHLPGRITKAYTLPGVYSGNGNRANLRAEARDRMLPWATRTAETVSLTLSGWRGNAAGLGTTVEITDGLPFTGRDGLPLTGRTGVIVALTPNWFRSTVKMVIAYIPVDDEEF